MIRIRDMRKYRLRTVVTVVVFVVTVTAGIMWNHWRANQPVIRFAGFRFVEVPRSEFGTSDDSPPYLFKEAVFRISNPSNQPYSYQTVRSGSVFEPLLASRTFEKSRGTKCRPPHLSCGLIATSVGEVQPKDSVEFSVRLPFPEAVDSFSIGVQLERGTSAEVAKRRSRRAWVSGFNNLLDSLLDRAFPDRIPGVTWSDEVWLSP